MNVPPVPRFYTFCMYIGAIYTFFVLFVHYAAKTAIAARLTAAKNKVFFLFVCFAARTRH